jgi:hypothetical protein
MSVISSSDFYNWKADPVTTMVMIKVNERIEDSKNILAGNAGQDSNFDNFQRGYIAACNDLLGVDFEDVEESE